MRTWTRLSTVLALGSGALLGAACGGNNNSTADARVSDAPKTVDTPPPTPDANVQVRSGTLAVTQIALTDPAVASLAFGGSSISLEFDDLTKGTPNVVFGTGGLGECTVLQFDGGSNPVHHPAPPVGEATITIDGAVHGSVGGGIKQGPKTLQCNFVSGQYVCPTGALTAQAGTYSASNASGGAVLTVTGHTFTTDDIGQWVSLSGFTDSGMNHTYPIVNIAGGSAQLGVPPGVAQNASNAAFTGVGITEIQGLGPIPGGAATVDFLDLGSGTDTVKVTMAANSEYPTPIDSMDLGAIGKGLKLNGPGTGCTDCAQPHQFPKSATGGATISFSCDKTKGDQTGDCGEVGNFQNVGLVITGKTTDGAITTNTAPYAMPDPVTSYATFTCLFPTAKQAQIPNGAIAAILATNPTRVETRVFRFAFNQGADAATANGWSVVVGHGLVGHTDIK